MSVLGSGPLTQVREMTISVFLDLANSEPKSCAHEYSYM